MFGTVDRANLAVVVVCFDVVICILFCIAIRLQKGYFVKEVQDFNDKSILLTDFAVQITGFPPSAIEYSNSLEDLKFELHKFIQKNVVGVDQIIQSFIQ